MAEGLLKLLCKWTVQGTVSNTFFFKFLFSDRPNFNQPQRRLRHLQLGSGQEQLIYWEKLLQIEGLL